MTILDDIKAYKLKEVAERKSETPQAKIDAAAKDAPPVRPFGRALYDASQHGYGLIAEIKRASPSKGVIREDFDPETLAQAYETGGAACLSVLTDAPSFQGHEDYLRTVRATSELPILRKDFLFDPWQVAESRAIGADCILIIMAAVGDAQAQELESAAKSWNMDVLVEVHNDDELYRAMRLDSQLIGINNRDLNTFETTLDTTKRLARRVEVGRTIVAESGITCPQDMAELARYGARSFLVGECLMREPDVAEATRRLLADPLTAKL